MTLNLNDPHLRIEPPSYAEHRHSRWRVSVPAGRKWACLIWPHCSPRSWYPPYSPRPWRTNPLWIYALCWMHISASESFLRLFVFIFWIFRPCLACRLVCISTGILVMLPKGRSSFHTYIFLFFCLTFFGWVVSHELFFLFVSLRIRTYKHLPQFPWLTSISHNMRITLRRAGIPGSFDLFQHR